MERQELEDEVSELLEPYTEPHLPLSQLTLKSLSMQKLEEFYHTLTDPLKTKKGKKRPRCPPVTLEKPSIGNISLYPYKKEMCDYITYITLTITREFQKDLYRR